MSVFFSFIGGKVLLGEKRNSCTEKDSGGHISGIQIWSSLYLQLASILRNDPTFWKQNKQLHIHTDSYSLQQLVLATTSVTRMPFDCSSRAELTKNFQMLSLLVGEWTPQ